jgi:FkbM family methyltransferase
VALVQHGGEAANPSPFLRKPRLHRPRFRRPAGYEFPSTCQIPDLGDRYRELFGRLKTDGTFVEVGAGDGDSFSNTSGLADLGWTGLYVEPVPRYARACARRHAANKNVSVASCAVGRDTGLVDVYLGEGLSTVVEEQVEVYQQIDWTRGFHRGKRIRVQQFPLEHLLAEADITSGFELLVVDVEGAEDAVFESFSLDVWKPQVMIVELIDHHPSFQSFDDVVRRSSELRSRIEHAGYREHYADEINTIFSRTS